jgi:hypothetical protein
MVESIKTIPSIFCHFLTFDLNRHSISEIDLYFGILGWIYINKFYMYPSPPLNENKLIQLARHVSI